MVEDTVTEVTSQSWFGRIGESIKGVLFGLLLFVASFVVLFWNEGRAVHRAKALAEGRSAVVSVSADAVDPGNEGALVHLTAEAVTNETLSDPLFGVSASALKLIRDAKMYQWEEEKQRKRRKKIGSGSKTTTTYSYHKTWSDDLIDSSRFNKVAGHENPSSMPVSGETFAADNVTVGAFRLSDALLNRITKSKPLTVTEELKDGVSDSLPGKLHVHAGGFYLGEDPAAPAIGDTKVSFRVVEPQTVSLVARQVGETFEPYETETEQVMLLQHGTHSADGMFEEAEKQNVILTWILRTVGFVLMFVGLMMILNPIAVFADVVPLVGDLLRLGFAVAAGVVAFALSLITVAIAWISYRPVLGILLLVLAVGAFVGVKKMGKARQPKKRTV